MIVVRGAACSTKSTIYSFHEWLLLDNFDARKFVFLLAKTPPRILDLVIFVLNDDNTERLDRNDYFTPLRMCTG